MPFSGFFGEQKKIVFYCEIIEKWCNLERIFIHTGENSSIIITKKKIINKKIIVKKSNDKDKKKAKLEVNRNCEFFPIRR